MIVLKERLAIFEKLLMRSFKVFMFLIVVNWKVYVLYFVFTFYLNIYPSFKHEINVEEGDFPEN